MVFKNIFILVLWMKVASALKGLIILIVNLIFTPELQIGLLCSLTFLRIFLLEIYERQNDMKDLYSHCKKSIRIHNHYLGVWDSEYLVTLVRYWICSNRIEFLARPLGSVLGQDSLPHVVLSHRAIALIHELTSQSVYCINFVHMK